MKSIRELYKIGRGPSSSHTMGPERAAKEFLLKYPSAEAFSVTLFGSLALTGKGHGTDRVLIETFAPKPAEIIFDTKTAVSRHPNTLTLTALRQGAVIGTETVYSVGGGTIEIEGAPKTEESPELYAMNTYNAIAEYCTAQNIRLWQYVEQCEGKGIWDYLQTVWDCMKCCVAEGLAASGTLPGGLEVKRKAGYLINRRHMDESSRTRENRLVCAYAFAASEQNAAGGLVVTAPTCGSSGVVPAVLIYKQDSDGFSDKLILRALATGGLIGNLIKTNASISGAECGCQAEIGSACSMAAAALSELYEMSLDQIEYAAEIAMEHHLGLTCDPINGLVQIPCIERNAVAAMRSINALSLANFLADFSKISFDMVIQTMYETGKNLSRKYRETAEGGLATNYYK